MKKYTLRLLPVIVSTFLALTSFANNNSTKTNELLLDTIVTNIFFEAQAQATDITSLPTDISVTASLVGTYGSSNSNSVPNFSPTTMQLNNTYNKLVRNYSGNRQSQFNDWSCLGGLQLKPGFPDIRKNSKITFTINYPANSKETYSFVPYVYVATTSNANDTFKSWPVQKTMGPAFPGGKQTWTFTYLLQDVGINKNGVAVNGWQ
jgi:hypothetical protein